MSIEEKKNIKNCDNNNVDLNNMDFEEAIKMLYQNEKTSFAPHYLSDEIIRIPSFNLNLLHCDIRKHLEKFKNKDYKTIYSEFTKILHTTAKNLSQKEDNTNINYTSKYPFIEITQNINIHNKTKQKLQKLQTINEEIHEISLYMCLNHILKLKTTAILGTLVNPTLMKKQKITSTIKERLELLKSWSSYNLSSTTICPSINSFLDVMEDYSLTEKTYVCSRVLKEHLRQGKWIVHNAQHGLFPGLYYKEQIIPAIRFFSLGKIQTFKEFENQREFFPPEIQLLIPPHNFNT